MIKVGFDILNPMNEVEQGIEFLEEEDPRNLPIKEKELPPGITGFMMKKLGISEARVNIILILIALLFFFIGIVLFSTGSFERRYSPEDTVERAESASVRQQQ